jgi:two-component system, LytTR family, response regulator
MKILIIEDEKPAVKNLTQMIREYDPAINVVAEIGTVREAIQWLERNQQPDLILLDIQLSDGLSLEIFKHRPVSCPVIFTTAYDEHILEAFNYNCIDYLLKPIKQEKLDAALDKYRKLKSHFTQNLMTLLNDLTDAKSNYKKRITVKKGLDFQSIKTDDIAFFYTEYKLVFLITRDREKFVVDKPLSDLENEFDPEAFFRINRKYLANINAISKFKSFEKGRLQVELNPQVREEIIVSQEKAASFKKWMGH